MRRSVAHAVFVTLLSTLATVLGVATAMTATGPGRDLLARVVSAELAGLPSIVHHGVDEFEDAGYSFCVPSIAAGYPRSWDPQRPGENREPGRPDYTGQFFDGLRNRITIHAVANPKEVLRGAPLEKLDDKASGYGLVRLNKKTGKITIECWPLLSDPASDQQFPGWPKTIDLEDNYGREATATPVTLPKVTSSRKTSPTTRTRAWSNLDRKACSCSADMNWVGSGIVSFRK